MKSLLFLSAFFFLLPLTIDAQTGTTRFFLKIEGIDGESKDINHEGWIELTSLAQGMEIPATPAGMSRKRAAIQFSDISLEKAIDKSSPKIFEALCTQKVLQEAQIHIVRNGQVYLAYDLHDIVFTNYQMSDANEVPLEQSSFKFAKIMMEYTEFDSSGKKKGSNKTGWDVGLSSKM